MISYLYLISCKNNSLYTGITTDLSKRFMEHLSGKGSKYCRAFKVRELVAAWSFNVEKKALLALEKKIQRLPRSKKIELIRSPQLINYYTQELNAEISAVNLAKFRENFCPGLREVNCQHLTICEECIKDHITKAENPPQCFATREKWIRDVAANYKLENIEVMKNWNST